MQSHRMLSGLVLLSLLSLLLVVVVVVVRQRKALWPIASLGSVRMLKRWVGWWGSGVMMFLYTGLLESELELGDCRVRRVVHSWLVFLCGFV